jgi:hypothetical protein
MQLEMFQGVDQNYPYRATRLCSDQPCNRFVFAREYCTKHYAYRRRNGLLKPRPNSSQCQRCGEEVQVQKLGLIPKFCSDCRYQHKQRNIVLRKYSLSSSDYDRLVEQQRGCCAICLGPPDHGATKGRGYLSIDHDHETGTVRGLLCSSCNLALGLFKEDLSRLRAAMTYLIKHGGDYAS